MKDSGRNLVPAAGWSQWQFLFLIGSLIGSLLLPALVLAEPLLRLLPAHFTADSLVLEATDVQKDTLYLRLAATVSLMLGGVLALMTVRNRGKSGANDESLLPLHTLARHTSGFGFWERNLKTGKVYLSSMGKEILGHQADENLFDEQHLFERLHPDDAAHVRDTIATALRDKSSYQTEYRIRFSDGTWHWIFLHGEVICDKHGRPQRTIGSFTDVTARKTAENKLHEQARLLDMIFLHSLDSIAILDKDYNFVRVNESYARSCQRDVSAFAGLNHFDVYPSDFKQEIEPFRARKEVYSRSARPFVFPDHPEWGTTYWDIAMIPILDTGGEIEFFLFTLKDVTVAVRAQEDNQDYIRRLKNLSIRIVTVQESERAALARELHDEIGQSLTAVKIRLQAMSSRAPQDVTPGLAEALNTVSKILEQVRGLSLNLRPMQLDDLGLRTALTSLVERVAATAGWKVHLDIDIPSGQFDGNLELACFRVAQEALTNVMRHAEASKVWITLRRNEDSLQLTVRDNGRGFDLLQAKSKPGVTHFGLFSMEERVRNMEGQFDISSGSRGGTVVRASFPLRTPLGTNQ